jgi:hypothetical protein
MTRFNPLSDEDAGADQHNEALVYVTEAFAEAILAGVESDSFAHAALSAAFCELVATYGEDIVASFAEGLPARVRAGEFSTSARH